MKRLTNDNPQNNTETALNLFFVKDGQAWVRRGGQEPNCPDVSLCDFMRRILRSNEIDVDGSSDQELSDALFDMLFYGVDTADGLIALLYSAGWAFAELRERLKAYEETDLTPQVIKSVLNQDLSCVKIAKAYSEFPLQLGDTVYMVFEDLDKVGEAGIDSARVTGVGFEGFTIPADADNPDDMGDLIPWEELGKNMFCSRAEAELALAPLVPAEKA